MAQGSLTAQGKLLRNRILVLCPLADADSFVLWTRMKCGKLPQSSQARSRDLQGFVSFNGLQVAAEDNRMAVFLLLCLR
jgi:hypothetical protein